MEYVMWVIELTSVEYVNQNYNFIYQPYVNSFF